MEDIFYTIFFVDVFLMSLFYMIGYYAKEREHNDTWGDARTMESKKAQKLAKEWEKAHPILFFFHEYYYDLYRLVRWKLDPRIYYREVIWFIQRGKRGYSDSDVWGFYDYLGRVIKEGLTQLRKNKCGTPCSVDEGDIETGKDGGWTTKGFNKAQRKWKRILDNMIWTFEALEKIENNEWQPVHNEKDRKKLKAFVVRYNRLSNHGTLKNMHLMTKSEMEKYNQGWEYFKKYFRCLWN